MFQLINSIKNIKIMSSFDDLYYDDCSEDLIYSLLRVGVVMNKDNNIELNEIFSEALKENEDKIEVVSDVLSKDAFLEKRIIEEVSEEMTEDTSAAAESNTLHLYAARISKIKLLTKEEELELGKKYFETNDIEARNKLVEANLRLVIKNAMKFKGRGVDILELIQAGNLGLIKAANKFDYRKGYRFTTYATWWVLQEMREIVMQGKSNIIQVKGYVQRKIRTIQTFVEKFTETEHRRPNVEEIAEGTGFSVKVVKSMLAVPSCSLTLDANVNSDSDDTFSDFAVDDNEISTEQLIEREFIQETMNECVDKILDERERYVIKLYYGFGGNEKCSLQEIGDRLGLTRERVRQIKVEALKKLRVESDINIESLI